MQFVDSKNSNEHSKFKNEQISFFHEHIPCFLNVMCRRRLYYLDKTNLEKRSEQTLEWQEAIIKLLKSGKFGSVLEYKKLRHCFDFEEETFDDFPEVLFGLKNKKVLIFLDGSSDLRQILNYFPGKVIAANLINKNSEKKAIQKEMTIHDDCLIIHAERFTLIADAAIGILSNLSRVPIVCVAEAFNSVLCHFPKINQFEIKLIYLIWENSKVALDHPMINSEFAEFYLSCLADDLKIVDVLDIMHDSLSERTSKLEKQVKIKQSIELQLKNNNNAKIGGVPGEHYVAQFELAIQRQKQFLRWIERDIAELERIEEIFRMVCADKEGDFFDLRLSVWMNALKNTPLCLPEELIDFEKIDPKETVYKINDKGDFQMAKRPKSNEKGERKNGSGNKQNEENSREFETNLKKMSKKNQKELQNFLNHFKFSCF